VKPEPAHALERLMQALLGDVMPNVQPSYRQASVMLQAMILATIREEIDRGAARRVEENAALRALFGTAAPIVRDAALRERLAAAAKSADPSLLLPALEEANRALRALLIELHAHVEDVPGDAARGIEDAIWRELAASTERRKLSLGVF
jgi:hypothetical protein